jgi:NitT/TauT family transport system substrate-binding protein
MPPPSLGTWQIDVAERKGFFQQQRLAVERVQDEHGKATEALDARDRDIGLVAVDAVVRAVRDGQGLVMVAGAVNRAAYSLIAARDLEQPADLKGKIVAVRDTEDATAAILKRMLRARGLADADYRLIGFDDPGLRGAAIANGTVGAALVDPPQAARLEAGGFKSFGHAFETVEEYQAEAFVIRSDWGRQNEERLVRFLRAIVQAERWIYAPSNKQEAIDILASTFKLSAVEAGRLYEQYVEKVPAVPKAGELEEAGVRVVTELLDEVDAIDPPLPDPASLIDTSYVTKAR